MELAGRPGRIGPQRIEKRREITIPDTAQHRGVQVGDVVEPVEGAVVDVGLVLDIGGDRLVGEQIEVDVRPQLADPFATLDPVVGAVGGHHLVAWAQQRGHQRHSVVGPQRDVVANDRGLDLPVQGDRGDGVLDAGDHQQFELHVVADVANGAQASGQSFGCGDRRVVGEQHGVELLLLGPGHQFLIGQ